MGATASIISFENRKAAASPRRDPKGLMEAVYAAGSLTVRGDDRPTKAVAAMLGALGFFVVEEIRADGSTRRLGPGDARGAAANPWRVSKADFAGGGPA
ncbi:MAG TPA: hypothetical protein VM434_15245 [Beijerinckiaceae bacterium]|nr:hypothetical protein [Beijerinckiaceae bacterium]